MRVSPRRHRCFQFNTCRSGCSAELDSHCLTNALYVLRSRALPQDHSRGLGMSDFRGRRNQPPVSPGCQAAASAFALTPRTSGCPAPVFPSGFAVCQEPASCGPNSGHGYAPCGRHIPIHLSWGTYPASVCNVQAMFAGSGIPPAAAPSFRGALPSVPECQKKDFYEVSRIEPSGHRFPGEPCTTHSFGVGGTGRTRTGNTLSYGAGAPTHSTVALPFAPLSHLAGLSRLGWEPLPAGAPGHHASRRFLALHYFTI